MTDNNDKTKEEIEMAMSKLFPKNVQDFIVPKYSLLRDISSLDGVKVIVSQLKKIPNFIQRINDLEFILIACNYIENLKLNKKEKISKDKMISMIWHELFSIDPEGEEMQKVHHAIRFLIDHKKIKKIPFIKKIYMCSKRTLSCMSFL